MNNKMQVVNLLPAELRQQRDAFDVTHLGRYLVLMLLLLLLLYLAQYWQIEKRQRVVAAQAAGQVSLQQQLQELKRSIPADEKQRLQNEVQRYQRAIAERRDIRRAYADFSGAEQLGFYASLAAIASHSDPSISIEQIELSGRVRHLAMFGRAHSAKAVPAYLSRLQGDPAMAGVVFDGLKLAAGGKPVSFKLGALKPLSLALEGLDSEQ